MTFWDLKFFWGIKRDLSFHLHLDLFQGWFVSEEISCVWLSIIEIGTWSSFSPQYWRPPTKLRKIGIFCISTYLHICYCAFVFYDIYIVLISNDCLRLYKFDSFSLWNLDNGWKLAHHCDGHNPNIVISSLHRCLFCFAIYTSCIYPERYVDQQASALFFVVFIIIIIFLLGSGYIMKRRCWRPDKKYQPARNWGRGRCNLSNVPKWTLGDGVPSLLHIFQIKWEIQCDLSAVWNNVCVIRRFDV